MNRALLRVALTLLAMLAAVALSVTAFVVYARSRTTTVVLKIPYDQAETRLFAALQMDKDELIADGMAQSDVGGKLQVSLTMGIHDHRLLEYQPGRRIRFRGEHRYNIFASGSEQIEIDLEKRSESTTRVTIDYFENANLFGFIPVTYQAGGQQETDLIEEIFRN